MTSTVRSVLFRDLAGFVAITLSQESKFWHDSRFESNEALINSYEDMVRRLGTKDGFVYMEKGDPLITFAFVARALICSDDCQVREYIPQWNRLEQMLLSGQSVTLDSSAQ